MYGCILKFDFLSRLKSKALLLASNFRVAVENGVFCLALEVLMDGVRQFLLFCGHSSTYIYILHYFTIAVPNSIKVWKHSPKTKDGKKKDHVSDDYHDGIQLNSIYFWTFFSQPIL